MSCDEHISRRDSAVPSLVPAELFNQAVLLRVISELLALQTRISSVLPMTSFSHLLIN